jgi:hypothetical protein
MTSEAVPSEAATDPNATPDADSSLAPEAPLSRRRRMRQALGSGSKRFAEGIPVGLVAALAALVLIAILFTVASRDPAEPAGYAELSLTRGGCVIDQTKQANALRCVAIGPRTYRVTFTKPLTGSTAVASRGSCCPGRVGVSIDSPQTVLIAVDKRVTKPIRVSVLIP